MRVYYRNHLSLVTNQLEQTELISHKQSMSINKGTST